jgi:hypothetical protein
MRVRKARKKQRRQLADTRAPDRYVVVNTAPHGRIKSCHKRVFTSYGDAARVTQRCSRTEAAAAKKAPCFLLQGWPGAERIVGRCVKGICGKPKDTDRKLIADCIPEFTTKKARRELIAARAKRGRFTPHHTGEHKATKSRTSPRGELPTELQGQRKRRKR